MKRTSQAHEELDEPAEEGALDGAHSTPIRHYQEIPVSQQNKATNKNFNGALKLSVLATLFAGLFVLSIFTHNALLSNLIPALIILFAALLIRSQNLINS